MSTAEAYLDPQPGRAALLRSQVASAADTAAARTHPTSPGLIGLLGGVGLKRGSAYAVDGSMSLALALAAGPSAAGAWCGVVGVPTFGSQSAEGLGIDLDHVALVPSPGGKWLEVVAALSDALDVVVVRPPGEPKDAEVRRLAARLRQRGATLVVVGAPRWPGCELRLSVSGSQWIGLGSDGHGHLSARTALVSAAGRGSGSPVTQRMWLPGPDGSVRPVDEEPASQPVLRPVLRSVR